MIDSKKAIGVAMALAAAGMISTSAPVFAGSTDAKVHCFGVNKCKGHNDCKTATNACKGQASCKGLGFVGVSAAACDHLGGTVK
jgi:hypothetical protein